MRRAFLVLLLACNTDDPGPSARLPTESLCPPDSTLDWDNFGRAFMESYCTSCHSSELEGAARHGAPSFHDFDTRFGVKGVASHVDSSSAAGPAATNIAMPPSGRTPSVDERRLLGEWLACDVP